MVNQPITGRLISRFQLGVGVRIPAINSRHAAATTILARAEVLAGPLLEETLGHK